jgi:hypothetical protein
MRENGHMLSFWWHAWALVFMGLIKTLGGAGIALALMTVVIHYLEERKKGYSCKESIESCATYFKDRVWKPIKAFVSVVIISGFLYGGYEMHVQAGEDLAKARNEVLAVTSQRDGYLHKSLLLASELEDRRHSINRNDPVFSNMSYMLSAFAMFRGSTRTPTGQPNCEIEITAPKESHDLALVIGNLSNWASACVTMGPTDFGLNPDEDNKTLRGMIDDKVVFHMDRNDSSASKLFGDLEPHIPLQLSYDVLPHKSEHFVSLQFGRKVRWSSQILH